MDRGALTGVGNPAGMTALDLACGVPLGFTPAAPLPRVAPVPFDRIFERAIERLYAGGSTLFVGFSGGRESAVALAFCVDYARRHGLADPVPVTLRHPALDTADDLEAQERIIAHLGVHDWVRVPSSEELDLIGPMAAPLLRQVGVFWPFAAYTMAPLFEQAKGSTFVLHTGIMDFFSFWRWAPLAGVLAGHRRPTAQDFALALATVMPVPIRAWLARRRGIPAPMPWMRPHAERRALESFTGRRASVPIRFDRAVMTEITHRCFSGGYASFQAIGHALGTSVISPLYEYETLAAVARAGGWRGFGNRQETLKRFAGHLLPPGSLAGRPGADRNPLLFGERSRAFAANWSGEGFDTELIDVQALRQTWLSPRPDARTGGLLQYAWLREQQAQTDIAPTTLTAVTT